MSRPLILIIGLALAGAVHAEPDAGTPVAAAMTCAELHAAIRDQNAQRNNTTSYRLQQALQVHLRNLMAERDARCVGRDAEPDGGHAHCWHARDYCAPGTPDPNQCGAWHPEEDVCCHCGVKRHCVGHGPHKPGCEPEPVLRISPYGFSPALMPVAP